MSSEGINMWGNEGAGIDISISTFCSADWMTGEIIRPSAVFLETTLLHLTVHVE